MPLEPKKYLLSPFNAMGRSLLKRLESPVDFYEKRIINNMQNLRKEIQIGDVLLVEGSSKISRIIQLLTKSSWSHAAFYVGDRLKTSDQEHMLIEAEAGIRDCKIQYN